MKTTPPFGCFFAGFLLAFAGLHLSAATGSHDYPFRPVPFTAVHLDDFFWAPRLETNRAVTIPYAFGKCEESGRMDNFARAAAVLRGERHHHRKPPGFPFDDTDPYKVLEGASYALAVQPDPKSRPTSIDLIGDVRRGAGTGRLSLHHAHDRPATSARVVGPQTLAE